MEVCSFLGKGVVSNTFLLHNDNDAVIIDASACDKIVSFCNQENLNVCAIILTHGHFDHTLELAKLKKTFDAPIYIHENDAKMLEDGYLSAYNVLWDSFNYDIRPQADYLISNDKDLFFNSITLSVKNLPGHTSGSTVFYTDDIMFTGDILFANSIGRCDLPSGDQGSMIKSLEYFASLPRNYQIFSGHGPSADLEFIKNHNQYLRYF